MGDRWDRIPVDIFVEILRRLPPSPRRRLRLVCRHWRNVIDDRMPATLACAMVLAFVVNHGRPRSYILDDLTGHGTGGRELELPGAAASFPVVSMVGTCNGLLCLRRRRENDLLVVNNVTGEMLAVPPPSESPVMFWKEAAYSFAYHPATGLYKIVHFPCEGAVSVFTLGDRSWREVPVPMPVWTGRVPSSGLASIGGALYWVARDSQSHSLMSLDLNDERVEFVAKLPVPPAVGPLHILTTDLRGRLVLADCSSREMKRKRIQTKVTKDERVVFVATLPVRVEPQDLYWQCHLTTDLRGRLVFTFCSHEMKRTRMLKRIQTKVTKVWTLDDGGRRNKKERPAWVLRCKIVEPGHEAHRPGITWPHVTHGEHVLTTEARGANRVSLHACRIRPKRMLGGVVVRTEGSPSIGLYDDCHCLQTFAYVETTEPMLYGGNDCDIGDSEVWGWRFDAEERRWKLMPHST